MDLSLYLQRIGYAGSLDPTIESLRALHLAHLLAVPFENLDVHLGRPIRLEQEALFDKIVLRRRGGFCYELNGLFAALLEALGFDVTLLSASDAHADGGFGPEFDHLALRVRCTDSPAIPWLADVGWGDTFREPLRLDRAGEQIGGERAYRIDREGRFRILWQRDYDGRWERQYRFTLQPRDFDEFVPMSRYHQISPDSLFTRKRLCTLATVDGRITLDDSRLITTTDGARQEARVEDDRTYRRILEERFGIRLDSRWDRPTWTGLAIRPGCAGNQPALPSQPPAPAGHRRPDCQSGQIARVTNPRYVPLEPVSRLGQHDAVHVLQL